MNAYGQIPSPDTVRIERILPGPINRVWDYLTDSEKRSRWLASGAMELHDGGKMENVFNNSALTEGDTAPPAKYAGLAGPVRVGGKILACREPDLLSYSWGEGENASNVTFELAEKSEKVLLVVTHRRIPNRDQMLSIAAGWHTHLDILAARLDDATPPAFWRTHTRLEAEYGARIPAA